MSTSYHPPLLPGNIYHMFNRAVGNEKLFRQRDNYLYFLLKYAAHVNEVCDTYCYCLLPNHFHLLIRIKEEAQIAACFEKVKNKKPPQYCNGAFNEFIIERFSNWLNGYTKAFNKMYERKGSLFIDYTKRVRIDKDEGFSKVIHYVHANAVHHSLVKTTGEWEFCSYNSLLSKAHTLLLRDEVLN